MIMLFTKCCLSGQIKKSEVGKKWGIQSFGGETLGKETNWKT